MSLRLGALHDALLDPGNAEKAAKAAEEVAEYHRTTHLTKIEGGLAVVMWMVGLTLVLTLAVVWATLR